ncbi:mariner Mos1 transposase [Trichonephila clavipes]|uniref:Mariner Mos1 transposase n=1 Tax=Trichonephila clavipes TaxID=2585209 RepID=A0A8X6RT03_TRICX|nr:mariner Mos1 transposase [Trichonephila clavipes]
MQYEDTPKLTMKRLERRYVPLKRYRLQNFAVPTIFTDFPTYLCNSGNPTRECPEQRLQRLENEHLQRSIQASIISKEEFEKKKSFTSLPELVECLNAEELQDIWTVICKKDLVIIMMLDTIISPVIKASVIINKDLHLTIHTCQTKIDHLGSCDEVLRKDLNMRRVSAKFVLRLLAEDQQFQRLATSYDLFQSASDDPELMKLITGEESWVYGYDPETKQESSQWKTPVLLGQRKHGREAVRRKRPVLWASSLWMLHHDGAPEHTANLVQQFLAKHGTIQAAHPPYSPDMSPPDFFLFPKIKNTHKDTGFRTLKP